MSRSHPRAASHHRGGDVALVSAYDWRRPVCGRVRAAGGCSSPARSSVRDDKGLRPRPPLADSLASTVRVSVRGAGYEWTYEHTHDHLHAHDRHAPAHLLHVW